MNDQPTRSPRALGQRRPIRTRPSQRRRSLVGPDDGVHDLFLEELHFDPGAEIPLHEHPVVEAFVVLEGALTVRLGDETVVAEAEHTVAIPPGTRHALANHGADTARAIAAAPWNHDTFFKDATTYLEGVPRC